MGEKALVFEALKPLRRLGVYVAGIWGEGHTSYPGRSDYLTRKGLGKLKDRPMDKQKSAEPILALNN